METFQYIFITSLSICVIQSSLSHCLNTRAFAFACSSRIMIPESNSAPRRPKSTRLQTGPTHCFSIGSMLEQVRMSTQNYHCVQIDLLMFVSRVLIRQGGEEIVGGCVVLPFPQRAITNERAPTIFIHAQLRVVRAYLSVPVALTCSSVD